MTEREAWSALVKAANRLGRSGQYVRNFGVIPPATATDTYAICIEGYQQDSATDGEP